MLGSVLQVLYQARQVKSPMNLFKAAVLSLSLDIKSQIRVGQNATYLSDKSIQGMLYSMSDILEFDILDDLKKSSHFSLMFDETTDISVNEQLVIHCRFLSENGDLKVHYLKLIDALDNVSKQDLQNHVSDGVISLSASQIAKRVTEYIDSVNLDYSKFKGIGTDGAAVMTGKLNGAVKRIRDYQLSKQIGEFKVEAVGQHCAAHKLSLAACQAGDKVNEIKKYKNVIRQLYDFYENSSVRSAGLQAVQNMLQDSEQLKVLEPSSTRWLSVGNCSLRLKKILPSVIISLDREAEERSDARAAGLHRLITEYQFIATLLLMCDILPIINRLSLIFQTKDVDFSIVKTAVKTTLSTLEKNKTTNGANLSEINEYCEILRKQDISVKFQKGRSNFCEAEEQFEQTKQNFLDNLIVNITDRFSDDDIFQNFNTVFNVDKILESCDKNPSYGNDEVSTLARRFGICPNIANGEWVDFKNFLSTEVCENGKLTSDELVSKMCSNVSLQNLFPSLCNFAGSFKVLPPHTSDCERDFSQMKLIKTNLRNRMSERTLDALLKLVIEGPDLDKFPFKRAVYHWAKVHNRRIKIKT